MTKQDWTTAPLDAQFYSCDAFRKHEGEWEYNWVSNNWCETVFDRLEWHKKQDDFEMRPTTPVRSHPAAACQYSDNLAPPVEWPATDDRIDDTIGQNGGDGEHYGPEWIEWDADCFDGCPVPDGHDVEVKLRDGKTERNSEPEEWNWYNMYGYEADDDIVAYRDWTVFNRQQTPGAATMKHQAQMSELYPQYYKDCRHIDSIDVYGVHDLFGIEDASGCLQHASKKILLSGKRNGGKDLYQDIKEARDTLTRKLQLMEDGK